MRTLEDVIKQQKPFSDIRQACILNIIVTANEITQEMDRFMKHFDLSMKQYNVLRILRGAQVGVSTSYIKERMLVKNADVSRIVDRLVNKGLAVKDVDLIDKRLVSVNLSECAKELLFRIDRKIDHTYSHLKNLEDNECNKLNHLLNKIRN